MSQKENMNLLKKTIELNEKLVKTRNSNESFALFNNYLIENTKINNLELKINNERVFRNHGDNLNIKNYEITEHLNLKDTMSISFDFISKENSKLEFIDFIKETFSIVSQTIYNKILQEKIKQIQFKDTLTGLYNRHYIDEYLKTIIPLTNREHKKLAFLKIGIDHFKAVIDEFDYETGDRVLKLLSEILLSSVRESDIVARIDSDEFLVILHNISNENNAILVASKLINNFKDAKTVIDNEKNLTLMKTICTGILICPDDAQKTTDIFKSSDIALYEARNKGRGQFYKFKKDDNSVELF